MLASTILKPCVPYTSNSGPTTPPRSLGNIAHELVGCQQLKHDFLVYSLAVSRSALLGEADPADALLALEHDVVTNADRAELQHKERLVIVAVDERRMVSTRHDGISRDTCSPSANWGCSLAKQGALESSGRVGRAKITFGNKVYRR